MTDSRPAFLSVQNREKLDWSIFRATRPPCDISQGEGLAAGNAGGKAGEGGGLLNQN